MSKIWLKVRLRQDVLPLMRFVARLICKGTPTVPVECAVCASPVEDELSHLLVECKYNHHELKWKYLASNYSLCSNSPTWSLTDVPVSESIVLLLGGDCERLLFPTLESQCHFLIVCARFLKSLFSGQFQ